MCQPNMIYDPSNASYPFQLDYLIKIFFEVYKNLFQFFILSMLMGRYSLESLVRPVFGYLIKLSRCLHFVNLCYAWSLCMHFRLFKWYVCEQEFSLHHDSRSTMIIMTFIFSHSKIHQKLSGCQKAQVSKLLQCFVAQA